ncbi:MAG: 50S ribosomal protein L21 [Propionibacteriaceae bacterium]|nr:50S ribosomal protein L21 [Propionibacteriaceae bacterium]
MYAVVRSGGRQHKVAEGDVLEIDKVEAEAGATLTLTPILLVDEGEVTADAAKLAQVTVTAEVLAETKGPKIRLIKFKNKTGYKKRQGHRQRYTQVKITGIK